jgi:PLP dependent protein
MSSDATNICDLFRERIKEIEERISSACRRAGRHRSEVTLVCVTKQITPECASLLPSLGVSDLGENRPQELWRKAGSLPATVRWHLIGHLQRNKIERTLPLVHLIHSVDSIRLLDALEEAAQKQARLLPVLLEVNASGEPNKHGFTPDELPGLTHRLLYYRHVILNGLMTMAALEDDPQKTRPTFAALRRLRDELSARLGQPHDFRHLSMGMTNDFEVAIEEGATFVRIGSAFFSNLPESS